MTAVQLDDSKLEKILSSMQKWSPEERSKYCDDDNVEDHPLFTKSSAATADDLAANPKLAAVACVDYDDVDTPESLAREAKDKGNAAFNRGPDFYGNALRHYNECIQHAGRSGVFRSSRQAAEEEDEEDKLAANLSTITVGDGKKAVKAPSVIYTTNTPEAKEVRALISTAYCNIAMIHLARKKFISAMDSAQEALRANPANVKAAYRAAKACLSLGRAVTAIDFAQLGLEIEPDNAALAQLVAEASALRAVQKKNEAAVRAEAEKRSAALDVLRSAVKERGYRVGPPQFADQRRTSADPYLDPEDGAIHWPVILLYPEYGTSDYLEDVSEGAAVGDILAAVLPSEDGPSASASPPPWDQRGEYLAHNCDVFYRSHISKPLPTEQAWGWARPGSVGGAAEDGDAAQPPAPQKSAQPSKWVRIPPAAPLSLALSQPNHVIPDIPVLYVIARSSAFYAELKRRIPGGAFAEVEM